MADQSGGFFPFPPAVLDSVPHLADFHLAQRCLEEDVDALESLQREFGGVIFAFLRRSGADEAEAHEIVQGLWADCLETEGRTQSRLATYSGNCSLQTWLRKVALNRLLTRKREQHRRDQILTPIEAADTDQHHVDERAPVEEPLMRLMRDAIEKAFASCPAEDFVLLQLSYGGELKLAELAKIFDCSMATISRQIERAAGDIAAATLAHVREVDPWLELQWEDFLGFCRAQTPSCFGFSE